MVFDDVGAIVIVDVLVPFLPDVLPFAVRAASK